MILYRFCSHNELQALIRNKTISNTTDHYKGGKGGSISRGFCLTKDEPEKAWKYLKGIVTPGVCLKFDIPEEKLTESSGKYLEDRIVLKDKVIIKSILKTEWCIRELRYEWLVKMIPLEPFVPDYELQAARDLERFRSRTVKNLT